MIVFECKDDEKVLCAAIDRLVSEYGEHILNPIYFTKEIRKTSRGTLEIKIKVNHAN